FLFSGKGNKDLAAKNGRRARISKIFCEFRRWKILKKITILVLGFILLLTSMAWAQGKPVSTEKAPKAIGPYSQAVWAGNLLFLSGQIGLVPETGKMIEGDTLAQAGQIFKNIEAILVSQELGFRDIVKVTVFGMDIKEFPEVNKLYATFFPENPPARSFVQAAALPAGAAIEIEVVAYKE
ncbi:MAG: Rid family detoxifying hydrolase, partial [Synergistaceae bacterium]|nr:Rid family detoxifying hydrolase [Synergistaceae bacterium]